MTRLALLTVLASLASPALGHLYITYPKPNQFDAQSAIYKDPLTHNSEGGHTNPFPCKGFLDGDVAAEWGAGSDQKTVVFGSAVHGGGSCQVSLSYDKGKTWTVMKTWLGSCPMYAEGNLSEDREMPLDFKVPADAPPGEALFAWSWFNRIGNREMYMNCAVVKITGQGTGAGEWAQLPAMFEANNGKGSCSTEEPKDLDIPNPGPQVQRGEKADLAPPTGDCPAPQKAAPPPAPEKPKDEPKPQDPPKDQPKPQDPPKDQPKPQGQPNQQPKPQGQATALAPAGPGSSAPNNVAQPPLSQTPPNPVGGIKGGPTGGVGATGQQQPPTGGDTDCSGHGAPPAAPATPPVQAAVQPASPQSSVPKTPPKPVGGAKDGPPVGVVATGQQQPATGGPPAGQAGDEWECADDEDGPGASGAPGAPPAVPATPAVPAPPPVSPPAQQAPNPAGADGCDVQSGMWCESKWGWKAGQRRRRRNVVFKREI